MRRRRGSWDRRPRTSRRRELHSGTAARRTSPVLGGSAVSQSAPRTPANEGRALAQFGIEPLAQLQPQHTRSIPVGPTSCAMLSTRSGHRTKPRIMGSRDAHAPTASNRARPPRRIADHDGASAAPTDGDYAITRPWLVRAAADRPTYLGVAGQREGGRRRVARARVGGRIPALLRVGRACSSMRVCAVARAVNASSGWGSNEAHAQTDQAHACSGVCALALQGGTGPARGRRVTHVRSNTGVGARRRPRPGWRVCLQRCTGLGTGEVGEGAHTARDTRACTPEDSVSIVSWVSHRSAGRPPFRRSSGHSCTVGTPSQRHCCLSAHCS